jgi:imidazolonepropionase-like amidohydrolase
MHRRMHRRIATPLLLAGLLSACAPAPNVGVPREAGVQPAATGGLAFVDVSVIPMDRERVLAGQTVVVQDGRIVAMGPAGSVRVPDGATRVEGRGRYLMPGLAEMHAHVPPPQAGEATMDRTLFLYLAGGVTTARGMLGHPQHLALRDRLQRGEALGPQLITSGPSFNGNSVPAPDVAQRMVQEQRQAGYDFLKLHPGLSRASFDAMVAAADAEGMRIAGHVPVDVGLARAIEARLASIDHLDGYVEALAGLEPGASGGFFGFTVTERADAGRIAALAAATRAAGVWNVPTQSLLEHVLGTMPPETLAARPEMRYMPPATVQQWIQSTNSVRAQNGYTPERAARYIELRRQLIRELHRAGAGLLLGSDAPQIFNVPGFAVHHELRMLVDAGLTPYQALETGTRLPAVFFGREAEFGTVATGRRADLLLLEANPLADIGNTARIAGVMAGGRWISAAQIAERLERIAAEVAGG